MRLFPGMVFAIISTQISGTFCNITIQLQLPEGWCYMKSSISALDKVSLFIIPLNFLSFLAAFGIFHCSSAESIAPVLTAIILLYGVFGSVGGFFLGISSSILSLLQKRKEGRKITLNLLCLILYLLMLPIWWKLFWIDALSV